MGAWRNNLPTSFATSSAQCSSTYTGHWTNIVAFWAGQGSGVIPERVTGGSIPDLTVTGASTQDDCWRFDGTDDRADCSADYSALRAPGSACTVAVAFRLLADPDEDWPLLYHNGRYEEVAYGVAGISWTDARDAAFYVRDDTVGTIKVGNSCYVPSTGVDYIAVGRCAMGAPNRIDVYLASDGSLADSEALGGNMSDDIAYQVSTSYHRMSVGARWNGEAATWSQYGNFDFGGGAVWSRRLTDTEVSDLVTDFYGPIRQSSSGSKLPLMMALQGG